MNSARNRLQSILSQLNALGLPWTLESAYPRRYRVPEALPIWLPSNILKYCLLFTLSALKEKK